MRFVETPVFSASLRRLLSDEQYRALQLALILRPEQGLLIPGTGGLRKLRWGTTGRGKRSGLRTIYYWAVDEGTCYMLYIYSKAEKESPSRSQLRAMARAAREEFK